MPQVLNGPARVALTTDAVGGVWTYSLDLARELSEAGIAVELVVLGPPPAPHRQREATAVAGLRLTVASIWKRRLRSGSRKFLSRCSRQVDQ